MTEIRDLRSVPLWIVGVYQMIHLPTELVYIGSSGRCIANRISWHRSKTKHGDHPDRSLQSVMDQTMIEEWVVEIRHIPGAARPQLYEEEQRQQMLAESEKSLINERTQRGYKLSVGTRLGISFSHKMESLQPGSHERRSDAARRGHYNKYLRSIAT